MGGDGLRPDERLQHRYNNRSRILHHAATGKCAAVLQSLMTNGQMHSCEAGYVVSVTPLKRAAKSGSVAVMDVLFSHRAWATQVRRDHEEH